MRRIFTLFIFLLTINSYAEIEVPSIFSDGMILQRDMPVKIWGKATPNAKINVQFASQNKSTNADTKGNWSLYLDKLDTSHQAREMKISENGKIQKSFKNVLVGEVWILGGQSNMAYYCNEMPLEYRKHHYENADNMKYVRQFTMNPAIIAEAPQFHCTKGAKWIDANKQNFHRFSAIGYFFAEKISKELNVPVGLIYTPRGATSMMCWLPADACYKNASTKKRWERFLKDKANFTEEKYQEKLDKYNKYVTDYKRKVAEAKRLNKPKPKYYWYKHVKPLPFTPYGATDTPVYFWNAKIAPIATMATRGVLWYQGCSDAHKGAYEHFEDVFNLLVSTWRNEWKNENLPFVFVQLASYGQRETSNFHDVRIAQMNVAQKLQNCFITTAIDLGEFDNIHPKYKDTLAYRMADVALRDIYKTTTGTVYGAICKDVKFDKNKAEISFDTDGSDIIQKGELKGFEILENDKWVIPTKIELHNNKLIIDSQNNIEGVRYLYKNWAQPDVCLYSTNGLPVFPFYELKNK